MLGRPGVSVSGSASASTSQQQRSSRADALRQATQTSRQRQIAAVFGGGPANRLLLSLRCGIPSEIDFALQALAGYSFSDAPSIPVESLAGLPAALLDLVRPSSEADQDRDDGQRSRRRVEAALILRNLILQGSQRTVDAIRSYTDTLFRVLVHCLEHDLPDLDSPGGPSTPPAAEVLLYMLESAEVYASRFTIPPSPASAAALSSSSSAVANGSASTSTSTFLQKKQKQVAESSFENRLYPLLAKVAQSGDRALVISSYALLGSLAMNEENEHVFADSSDASDLLLERALRLLPLDDGAITLPALEFLYQHTSSPWNASRILLRGDLRDLFRLVAFRIAEGATRDIFEFEVRSPSQTAFSAQERGRQVRSAFMDAYPTLAVQTARETRVNTELPAEMQLDEASLTHILPLPEPERVREWLLAVFEWDPDADVAQVALWRAYQSQFEVYDLQMGQGLIPPMLNAQEVIKSVTAAFPQAQPKMAEDPTAPNGRRYSIGGLRPRGRAMTRALSALRDRWRCKWRGCTTMSRPFDSSAALFQHLREQHVQPSTATVAPQNCLFGKCDAFFSTGQELLAHLKTHILPSGPAHPSAPTQVVLAADALDRDKLVFQASRLRAQQGENGTAAGIGFLATLVLRNCARAVASAAGNYRGTIEEEQGDRERDARRRYYTGRQQQQQQQQDGSAGVVAADSTSTERDERMSAFLAGRLVETEGDQPLLASQREAKLSNEQLKRAVVSLLGVQTLVIDHASSIAQLSPYLMETLECIESTKQSVRGML